VRKMKYKKPECCQKITEEEWNAPLGYCWAFALAQDEGDECDCQKCGKVISLNPNSN